MKTHFSDTYNEFGGINPFCRSESADTAKVTFDPDLVTCNLCIRKLMEETNYPLIRGQRYFDYPSEVN